jgi:tripartite-type tricarboxylate transporter receptor subunit TctC
MQLLKTAMNALVATLTALQCASLFAQAAGNFPSRPITIVVPFPPGANADTEMRVYQEGLRPQFKQPVLVDNKPGGSGVIAGSYVAKAAPDGHTLMFVNPTNTSLPALRKDMPYDLLRDFEPVILTTKNTFVLLSNPTFPPRTFPEFIAYAKARPGEVTWGTLGEGGTFHLAGAWLANTAGVKFTFVPYKGGAAAEVDLLAGRINVIPKNLSASLAALKTGKVRALAVLTEESSPAQPDIKPVSEMGYPDFSYSAWIGLATPAGTPAPIVNILSTAVAKAIKTPAAQKRWEAQGSVAVGYGPDAFRKFLVKEMAVWARIVRENNIKLDE